MFLSELSQKAFNRMHLPAMGRVVGAFTRHRWTFIGVLSLGFVIAAIQPVSVMLSQRIVDQLKRGTDLDPSFFRWVPAALIAVFVVSGLAKYFHNSWRRYLAEEIIIHFRENLFKKYLNLPMRVLDQKRTGEMLAGLQNDLQQINSGIDTFCLVLKEPFTFLGLMGAALYCDWKLTLATLVVAPLVAILFSRSGAAVKRYSARNLEQFADLLSLSQESITGARIVKVFRLEQPLSTRFKEIQEGYLKTIWKSIRVQELATPLVELVGAILIAGVLIYGGVQASNGNLTSGQLVAFVIAIGLAQMPIKQLNNAFLKLKTAEAAAEKLFAILDSPETGAGNTTSIRKTHFDSEIRFDRVSLHYGEKQALNQVSFAVKCGETVAFVGESGSGKTSIINLLPRLYEVSSGRILLDGTDIRDIDLYDLRSLMSFVTQETFLFNDTIFNNIRFGNPLATPEEIEWAARHAHCTDFIGRLPHGIQTRIGDRGSMLSGGERQRVAIARAFLKNAPILVLDEATSNLDSQSEKVVQTALDELASGRTTFMVAHRLSTVRRANQIFVMEQGHLIESGTHQELNQRAGVYQRHLGIQESLI